MFKELNCSAYIYLAKNIKLIKIMILLITNFADDTSFARTFDLTKYLALVKILSLLEALILLE